MDPLEKSQLLSTQEQIQIEILPIGKQDKKLKRNSTDKILRIYALILILISLAVLILWAFKFAPLFKCPFAQHKKRNVIFMVSDGFGPASETFARDFYQHVKNGNGQLPPWKGGDFPQQLQLDTIMVGQSRTRSADSWITDSAAGATAFSCGLKSYNGAIAVNSTQVPCATVMEAAKKVGYKTGMVVTSRITHATPAAFSSHVTWRDYESQIAAHQIGDNPFGRSVDLMFGGGARFFKSNSSCETCRDDSRDLVKEATEKYGFKKFLNTRVDFDGISSSNELPLIGLFNDDHMNYEIDRDAAVEPALWEMAEKALKLLSKASSTSDKGFFLLVEGSRIDMAAHDNDPASHAHEILAYQKTIEVVKQFVAEHPDTVMISVSDHETGGLTLGRQLTSAYPDYQWFPEVIARQRNSTAVHAKLIQDTPIGERKDFVRNIILPFYIGMDDFTEDDVIYLADSSRKFGEIMWKLGDMVSRRALIGWSTHGHTGVDVNLYAFSGKQPDLVNDLRKNLENVELGWFMERFMQLPRELMEEMNTNLINAWRNGKLITHPPGRPPIPARTLDLLDAHDEHPFPKKSGDDAFHHFMI